MMAVARGAILLGAPQRGRVPFAVRVTGVEKDNLDVVVRTELVPDREEIFETLSYTLRVPLDPAKMVDKEAIASRIERRLGRRMGDNELFRGEDGRYTTLFAEMVKRLEQGRTIGRALGRAPKAAARGAGAGADVDLDDYRKPAASAYCRDGALIYSRLDQQIYPTGGGAGATKIGTDGCFSLGASAVVQMNDTNYFKAYVTGSQKLWLDLIFVAQAQDHISETLKLIQGHIPLFGSFFLGVSMSFGVDLGAEVDVDAGLSVVGGFNQQWSMKRGFVVENGEVSKIVDKDDHFEMHPLSIEGAVSIYGEVSLQPYFGISIDVLLMSAANGGIRLKPYVYGEVDFQGEVYAGNQDLGAFTYETCYDMGYGISWSYFIKGLFGAISYTSDAYKIVGRKSFLRGGTKECFPADAEGRPAPLTQEQMEQIADHFGSCLDWSEGWENSDVPAGYLTCRLIGDTHYSAMRELGPVYDVEPAKWAPGGLYAERYDDWDLGGKSATPEEEPVLAAFWVDTFTYGSAYASFPPDSLSALYGAETEADLYAKHKPAEAGGVIQELIDTQCTEKDNKYIWTGYKSELCTHIWDWYQEGYYGPPIHLLTTTVEDTLGAEVYDPLTGTWETDEDVATESYEETRLVYADDPDDPFHVKLKLLRWSPQYCFDWHKVVQKSTLPEDMEFFLSKCKEALLDEPEANPDKVVGENRRTLYEKISEPYCEHLECPYPALGAELCPDGLYEQDGTLQAARRKADKVWDPLQGDGFTPIGDAVCTEVAAPDPDAEGCGAPDDCKEACTFDGLDTNRLDCARCLAEVAHCKDDCATVPFCSPIDQGTVYCTTEYWRAIRRDCVDRGKVDAAQVAGELEEGGVDTLTPLELPTRDGRPDREAIERLLRDHFEGVRGLRLSNVEVTSPTPPAASYNPIPGQ